jgi:hypothetical protein
MEGVQMAIDKIPHCVAAGTENVVNQVTMVLEEEEADKGRVKWLGGLWSRK